MFTDGGARGNPGPAGIGAVIKDANGKTLKEISESLGKQTNNHAEYMAVIFAMEALRRIIKKEDRKNAEVEVKMDSELVCRQLNDKYELKTEALFPLFIKIRNLRISHFPKIKFSHIPREQNHQADKLANLAMDVNEGKRVDQLFN